MKTLFTHTKNHSWKAIAFLTAVIFIFSCTSCDPEIPELQKPVILLGATNITETSALLTVKLVPGEDNTQIFYRYRLDNGEQWTAGSFSEGKQFSGRDTVELSALIESLTPGFKYFVQVIASNAAGEISDFIRFITPAWQMPYGEIKEIKDIKLDNITIALNFVPKHENTTATLAYRAEYSVWQSRVIGTNFSGNDTVRLETILDGLAKNGKYSIYLQLSNKAGNFSSSSKSFQTYAVCDYDGNYYHSVKIGTQVWLQENFRGTHYANGDPIPNVTNPEVWENLTTGAYCWYNNDPVIGEVYGGLYNWHVVSDPRELIDGWHVADIYEWARLSNQYENTFLAGLAIMEAGYEHWKNAAYKATNKSGFTALPNGGISGLPKSGFVFMNIQESATFWISSDMGVYGASTIIDDYMCLLDFGGLYSKNNGFGLRLIKN